MSNWKTRYPLRSRLDAAEQVIATVAVEYGLELADMRGLKLTGRRTGQGGLVFAARVEAARRCIAVCIRPGHFGQVLGLGRRTAERIYGRFWRVGRGPECTRRAAS